MSSSGGKDYRSSSSTETFKTLANVRSSMSVTNRCPLSIRWTAFFSKSSPATCKRSAKPFCDSLGRVASRSRATFFPHRFSVPSLFLFLNMTSPL